MQVRQLILFLFYTFLEKLSAFPIGSSSTGHKKEGSFVLNINRATIESLKNKCSLSNGGVCANLDTRLGISEVKTGSGLVFRGNGSLHEGTKVPLSTPHHQCVSPPPLRGSVSCCPVVDT